MLGGILPLLELSNLQDKSTTWKPHHSMAKISNRKVEPGWHCSIANKINVTTDQDHGKAFRGSNSPPNSSTGIERRKWTKYDILCT